MEAARLAIETAVTGKRCETVKTRRRRWEYTFAKDFASSKDA